MASEPQRPAIIPSIIYKDRPAALKWLEKAFGFEVSELLTDSNGEIAYAEMRHGGGLIMIGNEFIEWAKSPVTVGGANTQRVFVHLDDGVDAHCERARAAGAKIVMGPGDTFYGERSYIAEDIEGHHWTFSQTVKRVTGADYEKAGFKSKALG